MSANAPLSVRELTPAAHSTLQAIAPSAAEQTLLSEAAKALVASERYRDAARLFEFLVLTHPQSGYYNRCFGICCEQLDRLDEAGAALNRALSINPADEYALLARAAVRVRTGDRAGALEDVRAASGRIRNPQSENARRARMLLRQLTAWAERNRPEDML